MAGILLNRSRQVPAEETPAFGGIAERFRRAGDLDRAIALCRDGLKRFPEQLSARVTLGWSLLDKGQYDAARAELEQVLRKAPDNLAAIRGLAELHDRTEGALPPEDERSWKSEEASAAVEAFAPVETESAAGSADRFAPIPVSLSNATAEIVHTAAHAEQVAEAAASAFEPVGDLSVEPIELEDPAAASMAAAEPTPFFVVEPGEALVLDSGLHTDVTPAPFEVSALEPVEVVVEIETPGAAALSAIDPLGGLDPDVATSPLVSFDADEVDELAALSLQANDTGIDLVVPSVSLDAELGRADDAPAGEFDWAGLASLTNDALMDPAPAWDAERVERAGETAADSPIESLLSDTPADVMFGTADRFDGGAVTMGVLDERGEDPAALFATPEGIDDIDVAAGQELADAIKALEEAAKRVEARLAPSHTRMEPAAAPEEIAAYDFDSDAGATSMEADEAASAVVDTRHDGSFELVAPDLSDLAFGLDGTGDAAVEEGEWTLEAAAAEARVPAFDFEAIVAEEASDQVESVNDAANAPVEQFVSDANVTDGMATTVATDFTDADVSVDREAETAETAGIAADLVLEHDITADVEVDDAASAEADEVAEVEASVVAPPDLPADVEAVADVEETDEGAGAHAPEDLTHATNPDEAASASEPETTADVDDLPLAAMVVTEAVTHSVIDSDSGDDWRLAAHEAIESVVAPEFTAIAPALEPDPVPVMHVYDAPVLVASVSATTVASELAALVATDEAAASAPAMGRAQVPARSPLAALERFLRKVQARQLELRGETVA